MPAPDISLLSKRRFGPLFVVQFLGAFNDNLLKFAMLFLANFGLYTAAPGKAEMLATIRAACAAAKPPAPAPAYAIKFSRRS